MPELSAAATLELWDAANALRPVERAVALARTEGEDARDVANLPIGRRDERLLVLHSELAGPTLEAKAACPRCDADAEFELDIFVLLAHGKDAVAPSAVKVGGRLVTWRPPDSHDLAAAADAADSAAAERVLLQRCVDIDDATDDVRAAVVAAMAEADPLAEVLVDAVCPSCEEAFVADLDVAAFVWAEVRAAALRLLRDVDTLARAYGWTEPEVLALGESRRQAYLDLVSEGVA